MIMTLPALSYCSIATQERTVIGGGGAPFVVVPEPGVVVNSTSAVVSEPVRVAKTAAEIEDPENVYFENVLMAINPPPPSSPFERWWGAVHPTFVVCWDHPETGLARLPSSIRQISCTQTQMRRGINPAVIISEIPITFRPLMFICPLLVHVLGLCWVCRA